MVIIEYADFLDPETGRKDTGPLAKDYEKEGHEGKVLCCPCPGCLAKLSHVPSYERLGGSVPDAAAHYKLRSAERHGDECRYPNPDDPEPAKKAESASEFVRFLRGAADKYIYLNLGFEASDFILPRDRKAQFRYTGDHMTARMAVEDVKLTVGSLRDLRRLLQVKAPGDPFYDDVRVIAKGYSIPFDEFTLFSGRRLLNMAMHQAKQSFRMAVLAEVEPLEWGFHAGKNGTRRPVLACKPLEEKGRRSGRTFKIMPVLALPPALKPGDLDLSSRFLVCGIPAIDAQKTQKRAREAANGGGILPVYIQVKSPEYILKINDPVTM